MLRNYVSFGADMKAYRKYARKMSRVAEKAARLEGVRRFDAAVAVVDKESIRELNKAYRNVDMPTDVLSFPANELTGPISRADPRLLEYTGRRVFLGDIYICLEIAREHAEEYGNTLEEELCFLTAHGMLHLMGYDHMMFEDEFLMREKQRIILNRKAEERAGADKTGGDNGL